MKNRNTFWTILLAALCTALLTPGAWAQPVNDDCSNAVSLSIGTLVTGTTVDAASDDDGLYACDDIGGDPIPPSRGVWYSVIGNGTTLSASTCTTETLDTTLFVFCNSTGDICGGPACVIADNDSCGIAQGGAAVTWCSANGTEYLLYVGTFEASALPAEGEFVLRVVGGAPCGDPPDCTFVVPPNVPPNDDCDNAITIGDGSTAFSTINATTEGPVGPGTEQCSDNGQPQVWNDIWYAYTGTCDGLLQVDTCGTADYDSDLSVYDAIGGCPTDNSNLLGCNDDGELPDGTPCPDSGGSQWTSFLRVPITTGQEVLIRVGGWGAGDFGTGTLNVECIPETTDFCIFADEVAIGGSVTDTTADATTDPEAQATPCDGGAVESPGRWYYVIGNGNQLQASLCATNDAYDSRMTIYCGPPGPAAGTWLGPEDLGTICATLECNGDPLNTCGVNESFDWCTDVDRLYPILVHGDFESGSFQLDIADLGTCTGDPACPILPGCLTVENNEDEPCGEDLNSGCNDAFVCPDTNGDGNVDVDDLTNVILDWGNCCSNNGDTDGNGVVDVDDLTNIILGWGPLPGGCVDDRFDNLVSGQTINGTVWALSLTENIRDTDWYKLTVGPSGIVTVVVQAELPVGNFIITDDMGDCASVVVASSFSDGCVETTTTYGGGEGEVLTPGQVVYIWFGVTEAGGIPDFDAPCFDAGDGTTNNQYSATVTSN